MSITRGHVWGRHSVRHVGIRMWRCLGTLVCPPRGDQVVATWGDQCSTHRIHCDREPPLCPPGPTTARGSLQKAPRFPTGSLPSCKRRAASQGRTGQRPLGTLCAGWGHRTVRASGSHTRMPSRVTGGGGNCTLSTGHDPWGPPWISWSPLGSALPDAGWGGSHEQKRPCL